jgi:hypothetical protein
MSEHTPVRSAETFQEGVCPVQSFVTKAIPVRPGEPMAPRHGRPQRGEAPPTTSPDTAAPPLPPSAADPAQ